jgi:hypothetical protein
MMLSWGIALLLMAITVFIFVLRFLGLTAGPNAGWLAVLAFLGALFGGCILACREAMNYAERQMVFVLGDNEIIRKRHGYPDVKIAFSEIETLTEELRWLIVTSIGPRRKIAVPSNVRGYEAIRAELAKHHALSPPSRFPLKGTVLMTVSLLSWAAVIWLRDLKAVIPAGGIGLTLLVFGSYRLWVLLRRRRKTLLALVCLGFVWIAVAVVFLRFLGSVFSLTRL